jgi:hypothetical protein
VADRKPGPRSSIADPADLRDGTLSLQVSPPPSPAGLTYQLDLAAEAAYSYLSNHTATLVQEGVSALDVKRAMLARYGENASAAANSYLQGLIDRVKNAADWDSLNQVAGPILGQESFKAGVVWGFAESLVGDAANLLGLLKMLVLAGIYQRMEHPVMAVTDPASIAIVIAFKCIPALAAEAKKASDQLDLILKELFEIAKHPLDFIEAVGKNIWKGGMDDWKQLKAYSDQNTMLSNFQAGRITGRVLYQVIMAILLVVGVAGAVAKIASKFPALVRLARIIGRGGKLEELAELGELDQTGGAAKSVGEAGDAAKPPAPTPQKPAPVPPEPEPPPESPPKKPAPAAAPAKLDSSIAKYARPSEQLTAQRLSDTFPEFNGRTFEAPPPPDPGYDWTDNLGNTYDAMGDGTKSKYFNSDDFKASIDHHLLKGNTYTVIDMTGYTPDQAAEIANYVDSLPAAQQAAIRRVGF